MLLELGTRLFPLPVGGAATPQIGELAATCEAIATAQPQGWCRQRVSADPAKHQAPPQGQHERRRGGIPTAPLTFRCVEITEVRGGFPQ